MTSTAPAFYRPKRDRWVTAAGLFLVAVFISAVTLFLWSTLPVWQRAVGAGICLLLVVSVIDKLFFTVYELQEEGLAIHSQLRRLFVPYREMREIRPTGLRALVTTKRRKRFALSLRNYTIAVRDRLWDEISISPEERGTFLPQLLARIDGERSRRATVNRKK